jgi:hypothetical protein
VAVNAVQPIVVPPKTTGDPLKDLTGPNRDAYAALEDQFASYGLASLAPKIFSFIQQGFGADTITLLLQDTPEYKQRFAGNELRKAAGLPVLSPANYLATESSYRSILQDAGLPATFYDKPSDFSAWIGGDASPTEIKGRVDLAVRDASQSPPETRAALQQMYGVSPGEITAYFLDRTKALPLLQIREQAAQIGGAALAHGFNPTTTTAEQLATEGISTQQAQAGYGQLANTFNPLQAIAERFGTTWSQTEGEADVFNPGSQVAGEDVTQKRNALQQQEKALFSGNTGAVSPVGLNRGSQAQ